MIFIQFLAMSFALCAGMLFNKHHNNNYQLSQVNLMIKHFELRNVFMLTYVKCSNTLNSDDEIKILKKFLKYGYYIWNDRKYNNLTLREKYKSGIVLDTTSCKLQDMQNLLLNVETNNYFSVNNFWFIITESEKNAYEIIGKTHLPAQNDFEILLKQNDYNNFYTILTAYKIAENMPLKIFTVCNDIKFSYDMDKCYSNFKSLMRNRKNLQGIYLRGGLVIAYPDLFTRIDDTRLRYIDTITKAHYPVTNALRLDMNFSFDILQMDNYGWKQPNGSFDGLVGYLERKELDFGINALFMRLDRIKNIRFVSETFHIHAFTMFRQPPLSTVTNIFSLPFTKEVWITILVLLILLALIITSQILHPLHKNTISIFDCITFIWGAFCQQNSLMSLATVSAKISVFTTFVTTLFLYTFYSANIVALLQSPSEAIHSLHDLTSSPLTVGVQDVVYNRVFLKESTNPDVKLFFDKKILPQGEKAFMRPHDGIRKMKTELFAYQVEAQAGYQLISDIFNEHEKCGLKEIELFKIPISGIPTKRGFPYEELFRQRLRWQRETGLMKREEIKWIPQKPKCENKIAVFVSVSLVETSYALEMLGIGMSISLIILTIEILIYKMKKL